MKKIAKILSIPLILLMSVFCFAGCTFKTYKLVGIVANSTDTTITKLEDITDETTKKYLSDSYDNMVTIKLKSNNTFSMSWTLVNNGLSVTYTQVGEYEIKNKENTIIFYTERSNGEVMSNTQQYLNGAIIFYDGSYFLAFK